MSLKPMPLSRLRFLLCFVSLCVAFVPVPWFGRDDLVAIAPVSALIFIILCTGWNPIAAWMSFYALFHVGAFTVIGALACFLTRFLPWRAAQWSSLAVLLSLPVACSFARVLTDIRAGEDTYTFWEVVHRLIEKV